MSLKMSEKSRTAGIASMRLRYTGRGRAGKSRLIDGLCALCGYERKYAIKVRGGKRRVAGQVANRPGSAPQSGAPERAVLKKIWLAAESPYGKRLIPALPLWLPHYEAEYGELEPQVSRKGLQVSPATIDRLLKPCRGALRDASRHAPAPSDPGVPGVLACPAAGLGGSGHRGARWRGHGWRLLLAHHGDRCASAVDGNAGGRE